MNQLANNVQYVYENTPRFYYNSYGIKKTAGIKIMAGVATISPANVLWRSSRVEFGSFFTVGCRPVVVLGRTPSGTKYRHHTLVKGIGTYLPDHRGIELHAGADYYGTSTKNVVDQTQYIHWLAIGW
jgi:hypothetical protein